MSILKVISGIIKPVTDLIDNLHTSDEEKLELKNQLTVVENEFASKVLEYDTKLMESRSSAILAEAKGESWLQRNWRPMMMLLFAGLLGSYWLGFSPKNMSQETLNQLFALLKLGIGGYIAGRSVEKVTKVLTGGSVLSALKNLKKGK